MQILTGDETLTSFEKFCAHSGKSDDDMFSILEYSAFVGCQILNVKIPQKDGTGLYPDSVVSKVKMINENLHIHTILKAYQAKRTLLRPVWLHWRTILTAYKIRKDL